MSILPTSKLIKFASNQPEVSSLEIPSIDQHSALQYGRIILSRGCLAYPASCFKARCRCVDSLEHDIGSRSSSFLKPVSFFGKYVCKRSMISSLSRVPSTFKADQVSL
ncbi:hypothetical protein TWF569_000309 [Orbilia oligospora]|uniref:Uncharacterized protein n=1 Tax=Orbilia oligospora TaxID=2813651 RepID=A0A7C8N3C8_ORBOL|nr:hypothetical protein TWF102_007282 [Orbilia oligospora]KAF3099284.1 hypothetical protein TWF103_008797 [Orbilia oligospora]KAF3116319.1 hypothetical protein TWF706_003967 [Orbilia oligospora]KAF3133521.1 hypothetical protein TWF594_008990 [Orbilia oligospora]KAF3154332.1 hypothetical protein TWF569_000309 [Orbilia oligospora]